MINLIKRILGIHIHDWSKWTEFAAGSICHTDEHGNEVTTGRFIRQKRTCTSCGYTQIKTETC